VQTDSSLLVSRQLLNASFILDLAHELRRRLGAAGQYRAHALRERRLIERIMAQLGISRARRGDIAERTGCCERSNLACSVLFRRSANAAAARRERLRAASVFMSALCDPDY